MKENNLIEELELTKEQVIQIVKEWYTNGMYADILQDQEGYDLEEVCDFELGRDIKPIK